MSYGKSTRLMDVAAEHAARYIGLSLEADRAMQELASRVVHKATATVSDLREYRAYKAAVRSLDSTGYAY